ncbi:MAG TPA: Ig-like domain-containing protein, partial [Candidatus Rifleibacterium sp.]|nr:Ig-like domain-containing protein [Candidatus Rifleibacterium sp.]
MNILRKLILLPALLMLLFISACNIFSGAGGYEPSAAVTAIEEVVFSNQVSPGESVQVVTAAFKLAIPGDAISQAGELHITRVPPYYETYSWSKTFRQVSSLYRVRLTPENVSLKTPASMSFMLAELTSSNEDCFIARKTRNGEWELFAAATSADGYIFGTATDISADWVIVKRLEKSPEALEKRVTLLASPTMLIFDNSGQNPAEIELNVRIPVAAGDAGIAGSGNRLKIEAASQFSLKTRHPVSKTLSSLMSSGSENSLTVDLSDSVFVEALTSSTHIFCRLILQLNSDPGFSMPELFRITALASQGNRLTMAASINVPIFQTRPMTVVTGNSPADGQSNRPTGSNIVITFSRDLATPVNAALFKISSGTTTISGNLAVSGRTMTFTPAEPLPYSGNISVELLAGINDADGLPV